MKRLSIVVIGFVGSILCNCDKVGNQENEISKIPVDFKILRYDKAFYEATPDSLAKLKQTFPYLFPKAFSDSLWIRKIQDTMVHGLVGETVKTFNDFTPVKKSLKSFFQHAKYYTQKFRQPDVVTLINEVDYRYKVIYTDSLLLIALDNYLGETHKYYEGIYDYIKQNMTPDQIIVDVAGSFAKRLLRSKGRSFISQLIYEGKKLYFQDLLIPKITANKKLKYTPEQLSWAETNEEYIWEYFIEEKLIYSTDSNLKNRFILPAPYSKFYRSIDTESPPGIGRYIGWKIVQAYMERYPLTTLNKLINMDSEQLFKMSKYKPKL